MAIGYVKLHRKLFESRVFQNEGLLKVWVWCLLKANYKETWAMLRTGKGQIEVHLQPGEFVFGRESAADELKMPPSTVWKRIKKLKNIENLNIKSNRQYSIITIMNWGTYQGDEIKSDSKGDRQGTGKEQARNTDKKDKKEKKDNIPPYPPWLNLESWDEFKKHRIAIKKRMTPQSEKLALKKLFSLTNGNGTQTAIIEQSIINGWAGLFELKRDFKQGSPSTPQKLIRADESEEIYAD